MGNRLAYTIALVLKWGLGILAAAVSLFVFAVIFLPIFASDPHPSRFAHCQSNMKQLGIAFTMYEQDNDNRFPAGGPGGTGWAGLLYPYVKDTKRYTCISDPTRKDPDDSGVPVSYSMNSNLTRTTDEYNNIEAVTSVAVTVILVETQGAIVDVTAPGEGGRISPTAYHSGIGNGLPGSLTSAGRHIRYACGPFLGRPAQAPAYGEARHDEHANYLCADGHTKYLRPDQVSTGTPPAKPSPQTGYATGTAASTNHLGTQYTLTFSPL